MDEQQYAPLVAYLEAHRGQTVRLAIDGRCAAGKTTLAQWLQARYGCPVIHMDEFFLQAHQRTPERLAQAGGNVDYERFAQEVLTPLMQGQSFAYQPYSCQQGKLLPAVSVPACDWVIVEGAYSLHPALRDAYTCKVMCSVAPEVQVARIRKRNGQAMLTRFVNEWIPLEEAYLQAYDLPHGCDFVIAGKTAQDYSYRAYQAHDCAQAIAIWNAVVQAGNAFPQEEDLTLQTGAAFFAEQSHVGVAVDNATNAVVGLYILHPNNVGRCGHICNASYAVAASARGQGIGEGLVRNCLAQAKALGFGVLQFNAVVASNAVALALYQKLGFTQLGVIPDGFRLPDGSFADIVPHYITL